VRAYIKNIKDNDRFGADDDYNLFID